MPSFYNLFAFDHRIWYSICDPVKGDQQGQSFLMIAVSIWVNYRYFERSDANGIRFLYSDEFCDISHNETAAESLLRLAPFFLCYRRVTSMLGHARGSRHLRAGRRTDIIFAQ